MDLSILIATRNRATTLRETLESLAGQDLGGLAWEVVVVDNGSTDETPQVLRSATAQLPLVALHEPTPGKNRSLNRALDVARGDLLVFTDDDVLARPGWLVELHAASERWPRDNIFGGRIEPRFPPGTREWLTDGRFPYGRWTFSTYGPRPDEGPTHETPLGPNVAFRRSLFDGVRFDEHIGPTTGEYPMGSEVELLLRLYRRGELFIHVPTAVVEHVLAPHHVEHDYLLGRARRCGRGNARLYPSVGEFPFFGVPLYHIQRLLRAWLGVLRTRAAGEERRWVADLTLHQVLGQVRERRAAAAQPGAKRFPDRGAFVRLARRRGLLGAAAAPFRTALRKLVRVDTVQFLEWDVAKVPDAPDVENVRVELFGAASTHEACAALCRFEMATPEDIIGRLERGDRVAVGFARDAVVGYAWAAYSDLPITELETTVRVGPELVVGYDGFVRPDYRGRGVLPLLDRVQVLAAHEAGRKRQLVYIRTRNLASLRSMDRAGKRRCFRATLVRAPLLRRRWTFARGARWDEYFRPE